MQKIRFKSPIRSTRDLLWFLPVVALVTTPLWLPVVSGFLAPRGGLDERFAGPVQSSPMQNFVLDSVSITLTNGGREEWQIDAEQAYTGERDNEIEMVNVSAMYIGTEKPPTNINSKRGLYLVEKRELILQDHVRLRKPTEKQEFRTDLLHYYDATKMAVSPGAVEIITPDLHLNAGSMDYDLATDGYDFGNGVRVKL